MSPSLPSPSLYPSSAKDASSALAVLTHTKDPETSSTLYILHLNNPPDHRLTPSLLQEGILPALDDVERGWRKDRKGGEGKAALILIGNPVGGKFFSNGLDLQVALSTPGFFKGTANLPTFDPPFIASMLLISAIQYSQTEALDRVLLRFLTFPIPTIAAVNGHCFAAGMTLALSCDYRVMKFDESGKAKAFMCMNEVEFGAPIPSGMLSILLTKLPTSEMLKKVTLEAHRFSGKEALAAGFVDVLGKDGEDVLEKAKAIAKKVSGKAEAGVWGLIKGGLYFDTVQTLTNPDPERDFPDVDDEKATKRLGNDFVGVKAKL